LIYNIIRLFYPKLSKLVPPNKYNISIGELLCKTISTIKKLDEENQQNSVELSLSSLIYTTFKTRSSIEPKTLINLLV
jgi:hypothetical protein